MQKESRKNPAIQPRAHDPATRTGSKDAAPAVAGPCGGSHPWLPVNAASQPRCPRPAQAGFHLFRRSSRKIRVERIDHNATSRGNNHQIHVFHRHSAKQNFVAENHGADIAFAIFKLHAHRADVRTQTTLPVGGSNFFFGRFLKLKLQPDLFRQAKKERACVHQRFHLDRFKIRALGILQFDIYAGYSHALNFARKRAGCKPAIDGRRSQYARSKRSGGIRRLAGRFEPPNENGRSFNTSPRCGQFHPPTRECRL